MKHHTRFGPLRAVTTGILIAMGGAVSAQPPSQHLAEPFDLPAGHLVICGGGSLPIGVRTRFIALAGGSGARLIVIPTASSRADEPDAEERYLEPWRTFAPTSLVLAHARDRDAARLSSIADQVAAATAVWISGGDQSRLTDAYAGTAVERALHDLLARGGTVGGTSAGAACMSRVMITGGREVASVGVGFDFLPGSVVDQHFSRRGRADRLAGVLRDHPGRVGFGIDEGTALVTRGRRASIWGQGSVHVLLAPGADGRAAAMRSHRSGATIDLLRLTRAARERAETTRDRSRAALTALAPGVSMFVVGDGDLPTQPLAAAFLARARAGKTVGAATANVRVAVVTTACADPTRGAADWLQALRKSGAEADRLDAASRAVADGEPFARALASYDAVWFAGDQPWSLVDRYAGTRTLSELRLRLAEHGGVVGATSYAAHALGSSLLRSDPLDANVLVAEGYTEGLGLLPGWAIETHIDAALWGAADRSTEEGTPTHAATLDADGALLALPPGSIVLMEGQAAMCVAPGSDAGRLPRIVTKRGGTIDSVDLQPGAESLDWRSWLER